MARSSLVCSIWQRYDFIPNIWCYQPEKSADPHFHDVAVYLEANVSVFKLHAVDAASVLMILWSGVERQHLCQRLTLFFPHVAPYLYWYRHLQSFYLVRTSKSAAGVGVGVCVGHVWLDVVYRSTVHEVGAADMYDGTVVV